MLWKLPAKPSGEQPGRKAKVGRKHRRWNPCISALYKFHRDYNYSLLTPNPRKPAELENEDDTKKRLAKFFATIEELRRKHHLAHDHIISFDEKPMWAERHKRKIWRLRGSGPAYVRSQGKEKIRDTVIMITDGAGGKYPLAFNYLGKYQQRIRVPEGYPALVLHTKTAMSNSDFIINSSHGACHHS